MLVQLIDTNLKEPEKFDTFKLSFPQKVDLCISLGLMHENYGVMLKELNTIRNRFAHNLGYSMTEDEVFELVGRVAKAGVEFSQDELYLDKNCFKEDYGIQNTITEIFNNIAQELAFLIEGNGGDKFNLC